MKANELMIDDWVYNKYIDKPIQVYPVMFSQMFRRTPDATTEDYNISLSHLPQRFLKRTGLEFNSMEVVERICGLVLE